MATHEIIIRRDPASISTEGMAPTASNGVAGVSTQANASVVPQQTSYAVLAKAAGAKIAAQALQSVTQTVMTNKTTEINVLTGSNQYAQRQAAINSVTSAGVSVATGAITSGSILAALGMGGGMAGAIGLGVSLLGTLINTMSEIERKKNELQLKRSAETQELDYLRSRAGPFYNGSR